MIRGSKSNEEGVGKKDCACLSAICGNVRKDKIVDDGCCTLTKDQPTAKNRS